MTTPTSYRDLSAAAARLGFAVPVFIAEAVHASFTKGLVDREDLLMSALVLRIAEHGLPVTGTIHVGLNGTSQTLRFRAQLERGGVVVELE